jgi:hypothetical protein
VTVVNVTPAPGEVAVTPLVMLDRHGTRLDGGVKLGVLRREDDELVARYGELAGTAPDRYAMLVALHRRPERWLRASGAAVVHATGGGAFAELGFDHADEASRERHRGLLRDRYELDRAVLAPAGVRAVADLLAADRFGLRELLMLDQRPGEPAEPDRIGARVLTDAPVASVLRLDGAPAGAAAPDVVELQVDQPELLPAEVVDGRRFRYGRPVVARRRSPPPLFGGPAGGPVPVDSDVLERLVQDNGDADRDRYPWTVTRHEAAQADAGLRWLPTGRPHRLTVSPDLRVLAEARYRGELLPAVLEKALAGLDPLFPPSHERLALRQGYHRLATDRTATTTLVAELLTPVHRPSRRGAPAAPRRPGRVVAGSRVELTRSGGLVPLEQVVARLDIGYVTIEAPVP